MITRQRFVAFALFFLATVVAVPLLVRAQVVPPIVPVALQFAGSLLGGAGSNPFAGAGSAAANAMCNPWFAQCGCDQVPDGNGGCRPGGARSNTNGCAPGVCYDVHSGYRTNGTCPVANRCQGVNSSSPGGPGGAAGALGLAGQLLQLLNALNQPKPPGAGAGAGGLPPASGMPAGCLTGSYIVTQPSADPCAIYQPGGLLGGEAGTQVNSNISDALLAALGGGGASGGTGSAGTNLVNTLTGNPNSTTGTSPFSGTTTGGLQSGLTGDVRLGNAGATVFANLRDGLTEVAGFFGGSTFGGQGAQSALTRVCKARPWAGSGVVAALAPDAFFDSLCKRAGYQLGDAPAVGPGTNTIITNQPAPTMMPLQPNTVQPEADIWAEPASVRLGARAFIFWNTRGVNTCEVNGPSFFHNTVSGAASTVSISGASTFSIECVAPDGTKVTDSVTVNLAI